MSDARQISLPLLAAYPNMPASITASGVYVSWLSVAAVGLTGYVVSRRGHHITGLIALAVFAVAGPDGLAH